MSDPAVCEDLPPPAHCPAQSRLTAPRASACHSSLPSASHFRPQWEACTPPVPVRPLPQPQCEPINPPAQGAARALCPHPPFPLHCALTSQTCAPVPHSLVPTSAQFAVEAALSFWHKDAPLDPADRRAYNSALPASKEGRTDLGESVFFFTKIDPGFLGTKLRLIQLHAGTYAHARTHRQSRGRARAHTHVHTHARSTAPACTLTYLLAPSTHFHYVSTVECRQKPHYTPAPRCSPKHILPGNSF